VVGVVVVDMPLHLLAQVVGDQVDLVEEGAVNLVQQVLVIHHQHHLHREIMVEVDLRLTHPAPELAAEGVLVGPEVLPLPQKQVVMEDQGHHLLFLEHQLLMLVVAVALVEL
jgi:hypothetical protein